MTEYEWVCARQKKYFWYYNVPGIGEPCTSLNPHPDKVLLSIDVYSDGPTHRIPVQCRWVLIDRVRGYRPDKVIFDEVV